MNLLPDIIGRTYSFNVMIIIMIFRKAEAGAKA
jgi:hypothetical protein